MVKITVNRARGLVVLLGIVTMTALFAGTYGFHLAEQSRCQQESTK